MQLLSDFVEDRDLEFTTCSESQGPTSGEPTPRPAMDALSETSGSTFVAYANRTDEDISPYNVHQSLWHLHSGAV